MKKLLIVGAAFLITTTSGHAQPKLTMEVGSPGGASDVSGKHLAEIAAANKIAAIAVQGGKTLTRSVQQVAENKTNIAAMPLVLRFLMSKGLGPYVGLGKEKGARLADNLRILYPYHGATAWYLVAFEATGIDSWDKIKGKTIFNGPPRGGALNTARAITRLVTGYKEGKDFVGKQIAWGQVSSIVLDRSVDAAIWPGPNPAAFMPLLMAAGKINLISTPKAKWEGEAFQKFLRAPGNAPSIFPIREITYGDTVNVISDDDMFRSVAATFGDAVHKDMDKALAKALTAAFIKTVPDMRKKAPFVKAMFFGEVDDKKMGVCNAGAKLHPGAIEAWEEAGHKVADCMKPKTS